MSRFSPVCAVLALVAVTLLSGCNSGKKEDPHAGYPEAPAYQGSGEKAKDGAEAAPSKDEMEAKIAANLAKLSDEDRAIAAKQSVCPISGERLGTPSMGVPVKLTLNDQPVFICCTGCQKDAEADPEKTLAKIKK